jgi:hypothetical protein
MCAGIVGATVGLIDVMAAGDRFRARRPGVMLAPTVVNGGGGAVLGGRF